jgi:hypothetical protein
MEHCFSADPKILVRIYLYVPISRQIKIIVVQLVSFIREIVCVS